MAHKRFCKHIAGLFMAIPVEIANHVLGKIGAELDNWKFEKYWD